MKLIRSGLLLFFLCFSIAGIFSQSLWNPDFKGYINPNLAIAVGDIVVVELNENTTLNFSFSQKEDRQLTLQFSGGEGGNLFSFLPAVKTGGNEGGKGNEKVELKAKIAARVTEVTGNGILRIVGTKSMNLGKKSQSVTIAGYINASDLKADNTIDFARMADATVTFKTLVEPGTPILTSNDIEEVITQAAAGGGQGSTQGGAGAQGAQPPVAGGVAGATAGGNQPTAATGGIQPVTAPTGPSLQKKTLTLTNAKKKELLLIYLNRMIQLIFQ